jgi:hypothetical protein
LQMNDLIEVWYEEENYNGYEKVRSTETN